MTAAVLAAVNARLLEQDEVSTRRISCCKMLVRRQKPMPKLLAVVLNQCIIFILLFSQSQWVGSSVGRAVPF